MAREQFNMVLPGEQAYNVVETPASPTAPRPRRFPDRELAFVDSARVPVTDSDVAALTVLLGRAPRGAFEIVVRDAAGAPVVIRNAPLLDDGTPMPTRYWLVDPDARDARSSRIESAGGVRAAEAAVDADELQRGARPLRGRARRRAARRTTTGPRPHGGVGGTRRGVKCLHAHYACYLAGGDDPVGRWVAAALADGDAQ